MGHRILTPIIPLLLFFCTAAVAQTNKIDSLKKALVATTNPDKKLELLFALCEERQSMHSDTFFVYAARAYALANSAANKSNRLRAHFYINYSLLKKGMFKQVIINCEADIKKLGNNAADNALLLSLLHLKSAALIRSNFYKQAINEGFRLLQKAEAFTDTLMQIKAKNNLGWAYMEMGQYRNAINWFNSALSITSVKAFYIKYPSIYNNIASSYNNIQLYDSALYFINTCLAINDKNDLTILANAMNIKADILLNLKDTKKAQRLLEDALVIRKRIGDPYYVVSDLYQLAVFYANNGQPAKGITTAQQGIAMAKQYDLNAKLPLLYSGLAESYKMQGNLKAYANVLENIIKLKDTLFENNSARELAELQAKYDVQKQENIIIQQKLNILQKDYYISAVVVLLVVIVFTFFLFYNQYRHLQKRKFNRLIKEQKESEALAIFKAEESQRKHIAAELHDNLGAQISFITSNIDWIIDAPKTHKGTDQKKRLLMIHKTSQGLMHTLRETIWALNKDKIGLEEFSDKLKAYIQTFLQFQPNMHFQAYENIDENITLKPVQALNIFRIFQEGVNNAIKYSQARNLHLSIKAEKSKVYIELRDDGIGFIPANVNGDHFGLQIMKHRAEETGFAFLVASANGAGTTISITGLV